MSDQSVVRLFSMKQPNRTGKQCREFYLRNRSKLAALSPVHPKTLFQPSSPAFPKTLRFKSSSVDHNEDTTQEKPEVGLHSLLKNFVFYLAGTLFRSLKAFLIIVPLPKL